MDQSCRRQMPGCPKHSSVAGGSHWGSEMSVSSNSVSTAAAGRGQVRPQRIAAHTHIRYCPTDLGDTHIAERAFERALGRISTLDIQSGAELREGMDVAPPVTRSRAASKSSRCAPTNRSPNCDDRHPRRRKRRPGRNRAVLRDRCRHGERMVISSKQLHAASSVRWAKAGADQLSATT